MLLCNMNDTIIPWMHVADITPNVTDSFIRVCGVAVCVCVCQTLGRSYMNSNICIIAI